MKTHRGKSRRVEDLARNDLGDERQHPQVGTGRVDLACGLGVAVGFPLHDTKTGLESLLLERVERTAPGIGRHADRCHLVTRCEDPLEHT